MQDVRAVHAAAFLGDLAELSAEEVTVLMDRYASEELASVFTTATESILAEVAPKLPTATRALILERINSLMLLGYLVRASEEDVVPSPPVPDA